MGTRLLVVVSLVVVGFLIFGILTAKLSDMRADASMLGPWSAAKQIATQPMALDRYWNSSLYVTGISTFEYSHDLGDTWSTPVPLDGLYGASYDVKEYVIYRVTVSGSAIVQFSKSTNNGSTWSSPVDVLKVVGGNDGAYGISILDDTLIAFTYCRAGLSFGYINASKSTDFGATWNPEVIVDPLVYVNDPRACKTVSANGKLYMVYSNTTAYPATDVVVSESSDMGDTWGNRQVITEGLYPWVVAANDTLYVTYLSPDATQIMFTMSSDGTAWSTPIEVGFSDDLPFSTIAAWGGQVFVANSRYDSGGGTRIVHVNYSADDGGTWNDLGDVTDGSTNANWPSVVITGQMLHLSWVEGTSTMYRNASLIPEPPIPEFSSGAVVVCVTAVAAAIVVLRRRQE